jgi:hypothetical protein
MWRVMTDNDPFTYRVKFKDIRVKPPADETSRARAKRSKVCQQPGCELEGAFPAPRQDGKGKYHFCQEHVAEYNRSFNFFEGMTEAEAAAFAADERHGHQRTWKFGSGPMAGGRGAKAQDPRRWAGRKFFDLGADAAPKTEANDRLPMVTRALRELDLAPDAAPAAIRARYAEYVRRFHPDANQGDRSSEQKLERVVKAGRLLKAAGLMKV